MNKMLTKEDIDEILAMTNSFLADQVAMLTGAKPQEVIDNAIAVCTEVYKLQQSMKEFFKETEKKEDKKEDTNIHKIFIERIFH